MSVCHRCTDLLLVLPATLLWLFFWLGWLVKELVLRIYRVFAFIPSWAAGTHYCIDCCESTKPQIGIIGAGVGGMSLGKLLKERGLGNVTLIDRSFRVGGKSFSYKHEGLVHELGSCYLGDGYSKALEWMAEYGLEVSYVSEPTMYLWKPQPDNTPLVVDTTDADENPVPKQLGESQLDSISFLDFVLGKPWNLWERALAFFDICKYFTLWLYYWFRIQLLVHRMGITDQGLYDELAKPFEQWCDEHNLPTVKRFSLRSMTVMLYGALSEIPTLYALRWNTPSLLFAGGIGRIYECVKGFDKLWECISWSQDVRLSSHVKQIHRVQCDGVPKYRIIFTQPEHYGVTTHEGFEQAELLGSLLLDSKRVEHYLDVDHIVWTLHLDEINDVVIGRSLTSEEEKLFRLFSYFCVRSQLIEVEGIKWDDHAVKIFQKGVLNVHRGHVTGMRRTSNKTLTYRQRHPALRKDFCVTYQYCPCNTHFKQGIRPPHLARSNSRDTYKHAQETFLAESEVERMDSQTPLPVSVTVEDAPCEEKKFAVTKKTDLSFFWPHGNTAGVGSYEHQADKTLRKDIAEVGGLVKEIVVERRYLYHPLLQPERIRANEMLLLEKLQGKDNIWYSGASTSFETVNNIVNYNVTLADRMKYAIDIEPHCWWPRRAWFRFSRAWNALFSLYNK